MLIIFGGVQPVGVEEKGLSLSTPVNPKPTRRIPLGFSLSVEPKRPKKYIIPWGPSFWGHKKGLKKYYGNGSP